MNETEGLDMATMTLLMIQALLVIYTNRC